MIYPVLHDKYPDLHDKLVLYFEEETDGHKDTACFVLYDFTEQEYFVCGSRHDERGTQYAKFHYYCRSAKTVLDYISFILNPEFSKITYGLYNYHNIFQHNNGMVNYDVLEEKRCTENEVAVYLNMEFSKRPIRKILSMLREIRY